jgi:hypothetical protein
MIRSVQLNFPCQRNHYFKRPLHKSRGTLPCSVVRFIRIAPFEGMGGKPPCRGSHANGGGRELKPHRRPCTPAW